MARKVPLNKRTPQRLPTTGRIEETTLTPANPGQADGSEFVAAKGAAVWIKFPDSGIVVHIRPVYLVNGISVELCPMDKGGAIIEAMSLGSCGATREEVLEALKVYEQELEQQEEDQDELAREEE